MSFGYSIFADTMADLTYPQVAAAAERGACVILPTGVIEEHGPHLPLGTDAYGAYLLSRLTKRALELRGVEALIAPPVYWGVNAVTSAFPGTFRTRPETARALHTDILDSLATDGFTRVFIVNHHGDLAQNQMLVEVVEHQRQQGHTGVVLLANDFVAGRLETKSAAGLGVLGVFAGQPLMEGLTLSGDLGVHAEETETALIMRWFAELVDYTALTQLEPTHLGPNDLAEWRHGGEVARRITPQGYFGAPRPVDPFLWRFYDRWADAMSSVIVKLLSEQDDSH